MPFKRTRPKAHERHPNQNLGRNGTLYRPEYCEMAVEYMAKGHTLTAFAGSINVSIDTVNGWVQRHPDFSLAIDRARAKQVMPWEEKLMTSQRSGEVAAAIFALKNSAPQEWREVRYASFDHNVNARTLTDEQLLAIASGVRPAAVGAIDVQYNRLLERPKPYRAPKGQK